MRDVTCILSDIEQGDTHASARLLPLVYDELHRLAAQKMLHQAPGHTLQATALVHEAYVRLVDVEQVGQWNGRWQPFAGAVFVVSLPLPDPAANCHPQPSAAFAILRPSSCPVAAAGNASCAAATIRTS